MLHSDEGIKIGSTYGEYVGYKPVVDYGYALGIDEGTEINSFAGFLDGSNEGNTDISLIGD